MECFLAALRDLQAKRVHLVRALHLLATDLTEIEQKVLLGTTEYRIHPDVLPKAIAFEAAYEEFQTQLRNMVKMGLLLDVDTDLQKHHAATA